MLQMRTIATDVPDSQSISRLHWAVVCKNGRTDRGPAWGEDFWGPRNILLGLGGGEALLMQLLPNYFGLLSV